MRAVLRAGRGELLGLSVVIPTLNAAGTLGECLAALHDVHEVIVVDGGSGDATVEIAKASGARVMEAPRGRGAQLRAGGAAAAADWLMFLHADTRLGHGWHDAVGAHIDQHPGQAACLRFRLDDPSWQARAIERGVALRTRFGLPYGDQALLVSHAVYDRVGGFAPLPLMEDVDLVRRLGRVRVLAADAVTSAERWRRDGWFRRSARNLLCLGLYGAGASPDRLARIYR